MPFTCDDHFTLTKILDAVGVPMFAAERRIPSDPFHFICVNDAHTAQTGLKTDLVRDKRPVDILSPQEAASVTRHYDDCANAGFTTTYQERHRFNGTTSVWNTTLQPVMLSDGRQRIIGTAIAIECTPAYLSLDDAAYYSAMAQMQLGKLRQFLNVLEKRRDVPLDMRNKAMMVGNITRSMDAVLDDIRALSEPRKSAYDLQALRRPARLH